MIAKKGNRITERDQGRIYREGTKSSPTAEQAIAYILEGYDVVDMEVQVKSTAIQRLNLCWVLPLFVLCIPVRFVLYGSDYGVKRTTRLGKILTHLLGPYNGYR